MATVVAQASGNFSAGATWVGGVKPASGDTAQTSNYTVTIDESFTGTLNPTGSGHFDVATGGITITGDLVMGSTYTGGGLQCNHASGNVTLNGVATGGAGNNAYGAFNSGAGTLNVTTATGGAGYNAHGAFNNGAGTLNVTTATGGAGYNAHGAFNSGAGTLNVTTATGGAGYNAHGAFNNGAGTLNVTTATAGAGYNAYGAFNNSAGTLNVDLAVGNNWGVGGSGGYAYGVYGSGAAGQTTRVKRTQSGPYGAPAIGGAVLIEADVSNSAQFRTAYGGATLTLTDPSASADWPAEADVRAGVEFDNGDKTGTAHIPAAANVALGIPVDATTGTAVLTAAAVTAGVWDAARSGHATDGTFGDTAEWAGSVDEAAIAAAVLTALGTAGNLDSQLSTLAAYVDTEIAAILAAVDTEIAAIKAKTDGLPAIPAGVGDAMTLANDAITAAKLAADAVAEIATAIRTELATELARIDAAISTRLATAGYTAPPAVGAVADAVLDEAMTGHTTPGTAGAALAAAGSAGDPWITDLKDGTYDDPDTAGYIVARLADFDMTAVTQVVASSAGHLTITVGLTFDEAVTGLTIPADWKTALWTLKNNARDADTAALVQLRATNPAAGTDGLQRLNGAALVAPITAADGELAVTQATGRIDVWLSDEMTVMLGAATAIGWDVKFIDAAGDSIGQRGTADVVLTETKATA